MKESNHQADMAPCLREDTPEASLESPPHGVRGLPLAQKATPRALRRGPQIERELSKNLVSTVWRPLSKALHTACVWISPGSRSNPSGTQPQRVASPTGSDKQASTSANHSGMGALSMPSSRSTEACASHRAEGLSYRRHQARRCVAHPPPDVPWSPSGQELESGGC